MLRLLFACLLSFPLFGAEELVVHLQSKEVPTQVYLAPLESPDKSISKEYLKELEEVLRYDFNHNAKTAITSLAKYASCHLNVEIKQKSARVKLVFDGSQKIIESVPITGHLNQDRCTLHQIHDTLFQALFHTPGIAQTRLLYTVRQRLGDDPSQWSSEVWTADYDGQRAQALTHEKTLCVTPVFVPAKESARCSNFLYVSYKIGQPKIYAAAVGDGVGRRLTYLRGNQLMPALSPKLDQIAFICDITGNPDLFVQDFSLEKGAFGKPRQIFCAKNAAQGSPSFSPDGKKLAFVSNKDGTARIYMLEIPHPGASVKDLNAQMISKKARENTSPAWSPDGKKIAYSAMVSGTRQIWVYDIQQQSETQITDGEGHKENPAWAPNSLHLVYNSTSEKGSELYTIDISHRRAVKITGGPGEKRYPAWETITKS